jgi:succinyl-CoA synthetase beta subunit
MKIHEYQAKQILARFGLCVPRGEVARTPAEARKITMTLGRRIALKAQVHAGGRGKTGGIQFAADPEEAERRAERMLGMTLLSNQTGPEGEIVKKLLVEEALDIQRELYLGITIDRTKEAVVIMASPKGGIEIENIAFEKPERILKEYIDPAAGLQEHQAMELASRLGLSGVLRGQAVEFFLGLYQAFVATDASLAEINPLIVTDGDQILALDAKMNFDDNALPRHPEIEALRDPDEVSPQEAKAAKLGLNYIRLHGNVGCLVNGAGLAMATMDIIQYAGGQPANFLDVGGGVSEEAVADAFRILTSDKEVKAALINIFGGIVRCDLIARGVVLAAAEMGTKIPVVIRLEGTNADLGKRILGESNLAFYAAGSMKEAAEKAVALARGQE